MRSIFLLLKANIIIALVLIGTDALAQTCPTSNTITITVINDPTITISGATTICVGGTATLTSNVSGGTGTCSYQWFSSPDGTTWTSISGATGASYTTTSLSATTHYRATYTCTGPGCNVATSNSQVITVVPDPSITSHPGNIDECVGGTLPLNVSISGGTGSISYQWQSASAVAGPYTNITGATSSTYTPPSTTAGTTYYRVVVSATGNDCGSTTSDPATVIIRPNLTISTAPQPIVECVGGTDVLSVTVSNGSGTISYQWQSSTSQSGPYSNIVGATNSTYVPPSTTPGVMWYQVVITASGSGCDPVTSVPVSVTVHPDPTIQIEGTSLLCPGETTSLFVNQTGGAVSCTYQWQVSTDNISWANITGATANAYTTPALTQTTYYRVSVSCTGSGCNSAQSAAFAVNVVNLTPITINGPANACPEQVVNFVANNVPAGTSVVWTFGPGATPAIANGIGPHTVSYADCGPRTVQLTANLNGCIELRNHVIDIQDNIAPTLVGVPANTTVNCNAVPGPANVTATDNCSASPFVSLVATTTQTSNGSCSDFNYTITRTWMAVDACGNRSTATQTIVVQDPTQACGTVANAIGGTAYLDEDNDGLREGGTGISGVIVTLYTTDASGNSILIGTTTTNASGQYQFSGLVGGQRYRVEFSMPGTLSPYYQWATPGLDGGTNIQFVTVPSCNASIGLTPSCCR